MMAILLNQELCCFVICEVSVFPQVLFLEKLSLDGALFLNLIGLFISRYDVSLLRLLRNTGETLHIH